MEWKVYGTMAKADKNALTEAVEEASGIDTEIYTQETRTAFEKALADAKALLADPDVSGEEVKIALSRLVKAQNTWRKKGKRVSVTWPLERKQTDFAIMTDWMEGSMT